MEHDGCYLCYGRCAGAPGAIRVHERCLSWARRRALDAFSSHLDSEDYGEEERARSRDRSQTPIPDAAMTEEHEAEQREEAPHLSFN